MGVGVRSTAFQQSLCSEGTFPVLGPPCNIPAAHRRQKTTPRGPFKLHGGGRETAGLSRIWWKWVHPGGAEGQTWKVPHHADSLVTREVFMRRLLPERCCSVAQPSPPLCDPVDCSTPGFPVLHHLLEVA